MFQSSEKKLTQFVQRGYGGDLRGGLKGIEKESLRVTPDGWISQAPHPLALGSALTHPYLTTDYSEALLEFITPPFEDIRETLKFLSDIHRFAYERLDDELLWATSMPCRVGDDDTIPIAQYGSSNVGTMKSVYRTGLKNRYGSVMQTISGIHFNYSFSDAFWTAWQAVDTTSAGVEDIRSDGYFRLIRNFQRYGWLISFLFGASPAVCKTFLSSAAPGFDEFDGGTWYQPHATSLRMSDIGYKNKNQAVLNVSYDNLKDYVSSLTRAIETPYADYEAIGLLDQDGRYQQLSTNFLQIENEFYSFIRPKQVANSGEKPTLALKRRGVQYVEIRALDVGAFDPVGCHEDQLRFVEAFLAFCLFQDSPVMSDDEVDLFETNQSQVACCGRDEALEISLFGHHKSVVTWAHEICSAMRGFCEVLDSGESEGCYVRALEQQLAVISDPSTMPSARVLAEMKKNGESFFDFAMRKSVEHQSYFQDHYNIAASVSRDLEARVRQSIEEQRVVEAGDDVSFGEYLAHYFAQS